MYIKLLGKFSISVSGHTLSAADIEGKKAPALIKLLALQRHYQLQKDKVIDTFWPDLGMTEGASQLYKAIYHIRKAFSAIHPSPGKDTWIVLRDDIVRLKAPSGITTDVEEFKQLAGEGLKTGMTGLLENAAQKYSGDLLPMDLYAEWTELPRDQLRQLNIDVLLALSAKYRELGNLLAATETSRHITRKDPLLEAGHMELMKVYARQGFRDRALHQFKVCCENLSSKLDLPPSKEIEDLAADIRQGRFARKGKALAPEILPPLIVSNSLVNRKAECLEMDKAIDLAKRSRGNVLVIRGALGMGKTRLAEEILLRGRQAGCYVYQGKAREMEAGLAYGPFIDILHAALHESMEGFELIPGEIAEAIPDVTGKTMPVPSADRHAAQSYLFARVLDFFSERANKKPLVLVLEDLHRVDEGSFALLHYLARHIKQRPILLVCTARTGEGDFDKKMARWGRDLPIPVQVLSLQALNEADHEELLGQLSEGAVSKERCRAIYQLSEGVPLFAGEFIKDRGDAALRLLGSEKMTPGQPGTSKTDPPAFLLDVVMHKIERLPAGARRLIEIAAVAGRETSCDLLASLWQESSRAGTDQEIYDLLDALLSARLLEEKGFYYRFPHILYKMFTYQSIPAAKRRHLHRQAAGSLLKEGEDPENVPVEQVAYHFSKAGDTRQAIRYLVLAAERAERIYAHQDAVNRYKEALQLLQNEGEEYDRSLQSDMYEHIGDIYRATGFMQKSFDSYEKAIQCVERMPISEARLVDLHSKLALGAIYQVNMEMAAMHLEKAENIAPKDLEKQAFVLVVKAFFLWHCNQLEQAVTVAHKALALAKQCGSKKHASQACELLAMSYIPLGEWKKGFEYEQRKHAEGWSPDIIVAVDNHLCLWELYVHGDQPFRQAGAFINKTSREAEKMGHLRCLAICHYALGTMYLWRGSQQEALDELDTSLKLHRQVGSPAGMAYVFARKASLYTLGGKLEKGWDAVERGIAIAKQAAYRQHCFQRLYGAALWNRLEARDEGRARQLAEVSEKLISEHGNCPLCGIDMLPWLILYYLHQGQYDKASGHAGVLETLSQKTGHPIGRSITCMAASCIEAKKGNTLKASELREQAEKAINSPGLQTSNAYLTRFYLRLQELQEMMG